MTQQIYFGDRVRFITVDGDEGTGKIVDPNYKTSDPNEYMILTDAKTYEEGPFRLRGHLYVYEDEISQLLPLTADRFGALVVEADAFADADALLIRADRNGDATFTALGTTFRLVLKKRRPREYYLGKVPPSERARWGNKQQMQEDLAHVLTYGNLPPQSGPRW